MSLYLASITSYQIHLNDVVSHTSSYLHAHLQIVSTPEHIKASSRDRSQHAPHADLHRQPYHADILGCAPLPDAAGEGGAEEGTEAGGAEEGGAEESGDEEGGDEQGGDDEGVDEEGGDEDGANDGDGEGCRLDPIQRPERCERSHPPQ